MDYVIYFLLAFLLIYLFYLFTVILQRKKYDRFKKSNQVLYFVYRYHISTDKLNMKTFTNIIGITNSFIMATSFVIAILVSDNFIIQLLIGLAVLIPLMLFSYHIIGCYYQKKEGKKNV